MPKPQPSSTNCRSWATPCAAASCSFSSGHELTVGELCSVVQAPQSTVSRHLKALVDGGWLTSRADGTNRRYASATSRLDAPASSAVAPDQEGDRRVRFGPAGRAGVWLRSWPSGARARRSSSGRVLRNGTNFATTCSAGGSSCPPSWGSWTKTPSSPTWAAAPVRSQRLWPPSSAGHRRRRLVLHAHGRPRSDFRNTQERRYCARGRSRRFRTTPGLDAAMMFLVLDTHVTRSGADASPEARRALKPGSRLVVVDMLPARTGRVPLADGARLLGSAEADVHLRHLRDTGFDNAPPYCLFPRTP
jgi:ArsR family transcriptional regulator